MWLASDVAMATESATVAVDVAAAELSEVDRGTVFGRGRLADGG